MQLDNPIIYFVKLYNTIVTAADAARAIPTSHRHFPRRRGGAPVLVNNSLEAVAYEEAVTPHVPSSRPRSRP